MTFNQFAIRRVTRTNAWRPNRRRAFTLTELLMVIGISLLLIAILLPSINRAYITANRNRMAMDLQAIATALEAYRQDHGDIPRTRPDGGKVMRLGTDEMSGAQLLCRALLGVADADNPVNEGDGADGPGFRKLPPVIDPATGAKVPQGKVTPPYLSIDQFKIGNPDLKPGDMNDPVSRARAVLRDREGMPILYYPGVKSANVAVAYARVGTATIRPMFDLRDTPPDTPTDSVPEVKKADTDASVQLILGDDNRDGVIGTGEQAAYKGPYLLVSVGPDGAYGPPDKTNAISTKNKCDDLTNFPR